MIPDIPVYAPDSPPMIADMVFPNGSPIWCNGLLVDPHLRNIIA